MPFTLCRVHLMDLARATPEGASEALLAAHALRAVVAHLRRRHGFAGDWDGFERRLADVYGCVVCADSCDVESCVEAVGLMVNRTIMALGDGEMLSARRPLVVEDEDGRAHVFLRLEYLPPAPTGLAQVTGGAYN
jgi:hypothetical protein